MSHLILDRAPRASNPAAARRAGGVWPHIATAKAGPIAPGRGIVPRLAVSAILLSAVACGGPAREPNPLESLRLPIGVERFQHQTFPAVTVPAGGQAAFDVPWTADPVLELGVVRGLQIPKRKFRKLRKSPPPPRTVKIQFSRETWRGPQVVLETTEELAVNEPVTFRVDREMLGPSGRTARVTCQLEALSPEFTEPPVAEAPAASRDSSPEAESAPPTSAKAKAEEPVVELLACLAPQSVPERLDGELNVLMLSIDTLRPDHLGSYGYARDTSPHLDRFAARSVRFADAVSSAPWTTPSHYSLFTSLYPSAHGNERDASESFASDHTLARTLRQNGFYTAAFTGGGSISSRFGMGNGFHLFREYASYMNTTHPTRSWKHRDDTGRTVGDALEWLEAHAESRFFLFLHHFEVHDPYEDERFLNADREADLITQRKALYDGDIRVADEYFGQLIAKLEELDLLRSTVIVVTSDHGEEFHEHYRESDVIPPRTQELVPQISYVDHAHSLYDELLRVPLIVHVPGLDPASPVIENQVRLIDVQPTILDILGLEGQGPSQGESLLDLMRSGHREQDPPAIAESTFWGPERKAIRMDGYKYIWIPSLDDKKSARTFRNIQQYELFDLTADPGETENLYERRPELAERLHRRLVDELRASLEIRRQLSAQRPVERSSEIDDDVAEALKALGYVD